MTFEGMLEEYFLEKVEENPDISLNSIMRDKNADSNWIDEQLQEDAKEEVDKYFKKLKEKDFEIVEKETR
jgi:hypothetical protein